MVRVTISKSKKVKPPVEPVDPPPVEPIDPPPGDPVSGTFKGIVIPDGGEAKEVEGTYSGTADAETGEFSVMGVIVAQPSAAVPVISVAPTLSPTTADIGVLLTCTNGTWTNSPTSYAYQWMRGGVDIAGATSSTYTTVSADNGTTVTCKVRATNAAGPAVAYVTTSNSCVVNLVTGAISNQTIDFGALTLAGAGKAYPVHTGTITAASITGGSLSGWTVASDGGIVKTAANPASGTLNITFTIGGTGYPVVITINAQANTYSVASDAEIAAFKTAVNAATASGKTLRLRAGTYTTIIDFGVRSHSSEFVIGAHSGPKPIVEGMYINDIDNITIDGIAFYKNTVANWAFVEVWNGSNNWKILNCSFESAFHDPVTEGAVTTQTRGIRIGAGAQGYTGSFESAIALSNKCNWDLQLSVMVEG